MKKQRKKREFNQLFICCKCGKVYKYKKCLFNHFKKFKGHGPLFDIYVKKTNQQSAPLQSINDKLQKIEKMIEGGTTYETVTSVTRRRVTRSQKPTAEMREIPALKEYKEKLKNGGIKLKKVPKEKLKHSYNPFCNDPIANKYNEEVAKQQ